MISVRVGPGEQQVAVSGVEHHPRELADPERQRERGRAVTPVERNGRRIAALVHDASLGEDPELLEAASAAAAVALENQQLLGEAEGRLAELEASRERIVAAGDAERRRLERNLHDGAQQRLVAIALQLRLLQNRVGDDPSAARLVASRASVATTVSYETGGRLPQQVELAAYFVASESLTNVAKYSHAKDATVRVWRSGGRASIEIADDGIGGADESRGSGLRGLSDRVEALDGSLRVASPTGAGTVVTADLPCA